MGKYAADTAVSQEKSRSEIEATLKRYGADSFFYGSEPTRAMIGFRLDGRMIKFMLPMPDPQAREFTHTPQKNEPRSADGAYKAWEQAGRQRWRALALVIKAKLEAVAAGITTVEDEFLAHTVLPNGATVGEFMRPQLAIAYESGQMPTTLMIEGPKS